MADIISTLPDVVLCHVLSFLPTDNVVATSVLSKRWRHLWRSVLALEFCDRRSVKGEKEKAVFRFNEFVYSVLISREADHSIKSFRLQIQYDYPDFSNVAKWVNFVVQRRLEILDFYVFRRWKDYRKLPIRILTCRTLVVLKLRSFNVEGFSSVVLPSLKTLHFEHIQFANVPDFMLLLAGCPILEDLYLFCVRFQSEDCNEWTNFSLSKLIKADIVYSFFEFQSTALQNVESLRIEIGKVFFIDVIPTFCNLTHLELIYLNFEWNLLALVLKHCPKLRKLDLDQADLDKDYWPHEAVLEHIWVDPEFVPQCLSLNLRTCNLFNFLGLQGELLLARYILKNATVLQTMGIWNKGQTNIKRLLSSCPRASATCKLTVH